MVSDALYVGTASIILMLIINYMFFYRQKHYMMSIMMTFITAFAAFLSMRITNTQATILPFFLIIIAIWQLMTAPLFKPGGKGEEKYDELMRR